MMTVIAFAIYIYIYIFSFSAFIFPVQICLNTRGFFKGQNSN
jgi:hypothetical protein